MRTMDDAMLVARAKTGDARAFEALVRAHAGPAYNLALRLVRDPQEAEDLAQEAFVRAWAGLPAFRAEARFSTWLYRIVTNLCYDRLPRLRAELAAAEVDAAAELADDRQDVDTVVLTAALRAHLHRAMDALPDGFRLLVTLRHLQGLSYADMAAVTGLPEGTVKSGLNRARAQLRAAAADWAHGDAADTARPARADGLAAGAPARTNAPPPQPAAALDTRLGRLAAQEAR